MITNKIDYAKKGWKNATILFFTFVVFLVLILIFGNFSEYFNTFKYFDYFFTGFYLILFILSLTTACFFFLACIRQKISFLLPTIMAIFITIYFLQGMLESLRPYPFD